MPANGSALHAGSRVPSSASARGTMPEALMWAPDPGSSRAGASARRLDHRTAPPDEPAAVALHHLVLVAARREHEAGRIGPGQCEDVAPGLRPIGLGTVDHDVRH